MMLLLSEKLVYIRDNADSGELKRQLSVCIGQARAMEATDRPDPTVDTYGKWGKNSPDTSRAAAFRPELKSGTQRSKVLACLKTRWLEGHDGLIDDELQEQLNMLARSENPRRGELVEMGYVKDSRARRKTVTGCEAIVWEYVPTSLEEQARIGDRHGR